MGSKVTVIPATINPLTRMPNTASYKRKVAGYARVSTDSDEQFTSYEAQIDYYTRYIQSRADWQFVKVYTDEGISGTNTKHREGFNTMVKDALDGKIDLIVTKSVSRFARNTVDTLVTVRNLKEKGVEVFFEKENIYTLDSKGELLITIMSSLAQEESRSMSQNVTWGQRKRFADGKFSMPYKTFLGYKKGENGTMEIVPEEADIIRLIYKLYMSGKTAAAISTTLMDMNIPSPAGKPKWHASTVNSILTNEKYKGDALLQKGFTVDFLTKKKKVNEGEIPQYYVENSHPAIIPAEEWNLVQNEIKRRKQLSYKYSGKGVFCAKLICGDCGEFLTARVWHSNDQYRKIVWNCPSKSSGSECQIPHLYEDTIKATFVAAVNQVLANKTEVIDNCREMQTMLTDCTEINVRLSEVEDEMEVVAELIRKHIDENAHTALDQTEYQAKYNSLASRYQKLQAEEEGLKKKRDEREAMAENIGAFMFSLYEQEDVITEFDDKLWLASVEKAIIRADEKITFIFRNGSEVTTDFM